MAMNKLTDILQKKVISVFEAQNVGVIADILFDKKLNAVKYLLVRRDSADDVSEKYIPFKEAGALFADAVTVKNLSKVLTRWSIAPVYERSPLSLPVYNHEGKALGQVDEVVFEGVTVTSILVGERQFSPDCILSKSDEMIVLNDGEDKIKLTPPPKMPKVSRHAPKTVTVSVGAKPPAPPETANSDTPNDIRVPVRIGEDKTSVTKTPPEGDVKQTGYAFLIGKTMTKPISDENGLLIDADGIIDEDTVKRAKQANKLVHLALYSR